MLVPQVKPIRVLLVEDSIADAHAVVNDLRYTQTVFEVTVVGSLLEAQRHMEEHVESTDEVSEEGAHAYDAVLLDLHRPNGRGLACIKALRAISISVPIIVLTGLEDQPVGNYFDAGADDYVSKSSPGKQIEAALYRAARSYRRQRQTRRKWQTITVKLSALDRLEPLAL